MAVPSAKSEILTCWDKNQESYFDKKKTRRDVDKFPVNFSVVPHIVSPLENIFGYLDFKDLNNCQSICKIWQNILLEKRSLWIELLEKEKIKKFGSSSENYDSKSAVHVLLSRFYPNFIQILSRFYPDFIWIKL